MKKTILILSLSTIVLAACSKPNTDTHETNQAPENTATQTMQPTNTQPATPMGDTAETSLDWVGEYKGVFPCADCEGIETELELKAYILSSV